MNPQAVQGWLQGLPPESRAALEQIATAQRKPLAVVAEEVYRKGIAAGRVKAPAAPDAPVPPAQVAPPASQPAAQPPAPPQAPAGSLPADAGAWFNSLPAETRALLEQKAAAEKKPLTLKVQETYDKARARGVIPAPEAAPGRRSEGPRAPDGTPIEPASVQTSGDDTATREIMAAFQRAVGPPVTREVAAKAPRVEGGAPPTPVPASLLTEKGATPVPAASAVAVVDDGPRGHINHGVISLKGPDGSILGQYRFVNGGGGAGSIPHGAYEVTNYRDAASRKSQGLSNLGDTFDLNDVFDARAGRTRTALRIHQVHGEGTLGCIGIQGGDAAWRDFSAKMQNLVREGGGKYTLVLGSEEGGAGGGGGETRSVQEAFARALGSAARPAGGYASRELQADPRAARILDFVAGAELNPANGGNYNAFFGNAGAAEDLGKRTLDQTIAWSRDRGTSSSATGRYQFMADTMAGLKKEMGLSGREAFTPELQDRMALKLLERRGYREWSTGRLGDEEFANRLAQEWASLPNLTTAAATTPGTG